MIEARSLKKKLSSDTWNKDKHFFVYISDIQFTKENKLCNCQVF